MTLNWWDRFIGVFSPAAALRNAGLRQILAEYEGGKPSRLRKALRDDKSPNTLVSMSAAVLRNYARHQERNHDLGHGIMDTLVRNVVGPDGVSIEPMPLRRDGSVHQEFADALMLLYLDWCRRPEVTWQYDFAGAQRQGCRSWLRDGDFFAQTIEGLTNRLDHGTRVPLSLEMLEADLVPLDYEDVEKNIRQGIEFNEWGRKRAVFVYKNHPGDTFKFTQLSVPDLKRVPAERMLHVALRDRLHQARGVSIFASVVNRLEDLKDYEDSERVAARIAAALTAVVKRNPENDVGDPAEKSEQGRSLLKIEPGTVFDGAGPGDEIVVVDSKRPNSQLEAFRRGQLRAVSAGTGTSHSSISKDYDGTYSAQRQELVEQWPQYRVLTREFVAQFVLPVWERFVGLAVLSNQLRIPADLDPRTLMAAEFIGPPMPWINPLDEANANKVLVRSSFRSATQVIRAAGGDPWTTFRQIRDERRHWAEIGITSETNPADDKGAAPAVAAPPAQQPDEPSPLRKEESPEHAS